MSSRAERRRNRKIGTIARAKEPKPTAEVVPIKKAEDQTLRDGLIFMRRKSKISARRFHAATEYRMAFREPQEGQMRSCLDDSPRGSGIGGSPSDGYNAGRIDAQRQLFRFRFEALGGQEDLIQAMDGIAGGGNTPRVLAGGDGHKALAIEKVFFIACDLIAQHLEAKTPQQARA